MRMRPDRRRSFAASALTLAQLRTIGDWGGASGRIGNRWEAVGLDAIRRSVAVEQARGAVVAVIGLCEDHDLQQRLGALGLPNPDVVVVENHPGHDALHVRPVDLKWALDVASYRQISGSNLADLLRADESIGQWLRRDLPADLADRPFEPIDGYFVCPDMSLNRLFLNGPANQRQEYPIEPHEVAFVPIDPHPFFSPLRGWYTAEQLARLDGTFAGLRQLDTADRYYHLGAGVAGAVARRQRSIFDDDAAGEDGSEPAGWAILQAEVRPLTTDAILSKLDVVMRQRRELLQRLRGLRRCPYSFADFVEDLRARGLATPEEGVERAWGPRYGTIARQHAARLMAAGKALVAEGNSDAQALAALEQRGGEFAARARAWAKIAIDEWCAAADQDGRRP